MNDTLAVIIEAMFIILNLFCLIFLIITYIKIIRRRKQMTYDMLKKYHNRVIITTLGMIVLLICAFMLSKIFEEEIVIDTVKGSFWTIFVVGVIGLWRKKLKSDEEQDGQLNQMGNDSIKYQENSSRSVLHSTAPEEDNE